MTANLPALWTCSSPMSRYLPKPRSLLSSFNTSFKPLQWSGDHAEEGPPGRDDTPINQARQASLLAALDPRDWYREAQTKAGRAGIQMKRANACAEDGLSAWRLQNQNRLVETTDCQRSHNLPDQSSNQDMYLQTIQGGQGHHRPGLVPFTLHLHAPPVRGCKRLAAWQLTFWASKGHLKTQLLHIVPLFTSHLEICVVTQGTHKYEWSN